MSERDTAPMAPDGPVTPSGQSRRVAWRWWRHTRPFWGGLLLLIAGVELLLIPLGGVLLKGQLKLVIYIGIGGVFGVLIGVLLILCGVMLWFDVGHKTFYAVLGVLLALLSFIVTNLGGFFVGMLLGIVGGSMAFAWSPAAGTGADGATSDRRTPGGSPGDQPDDPAAGEPPTEPTNAGISLILGAPTAAPSTSQAPEDVPEEGKGGSVAGGSPGCGSEPRDRPVRAHRRPLRPARMIRGRRGGHLLAAVALTGALTGSLLVAGRQPAADAAVTRPQGGSGCILFIFCPPAPSPSPTPQPTTSGPSGTAPPSPSGGLLPSLGGTPSPTSGIPRRSPTGTRTTRAGARSPMASGPPGLQAATATVVEKAGSVTLHGFAYQGVAVVPVAGGGSVRMMKFTATTITLTGGVTLTAVQDGRTLATTDTSLDLTGGVVLYATQLSGDLAGVPITLTPGNVESLLLQLLKSVTPAVPVTMTNVTTDQPLVSTGFLDASGLVVRAS